MECPKCRREESVKAGFNNKKQRYKCKHCGCYYTKSYKAGYHPDIKRKAIQLYLEGVGFRQIERIMSISNVTVLYWVRDLAKKLKEYVKQNKKPQQVDILELDELYTYVKKSPMMFGSGLQLIEIPKRYWDTILALVD